MISYSATFQMHILSTMCHDDVLKYVTVPGPAAAPWHWHTGSTSLPGWLGAWVLLVQLGKFIKWYVPVTVCHGTEYIRVSEVPVGGPSPYRDITYHDVQLEYDWYVELEYVSLPSWYQAYRCRTWHIICHIGLHTWLPVKFQVYYHGFTGKSML